MTTPEAVRRVLASLTEPLLGHSLVDLGMVQGIRVARGGRVTVQLALPSPHWPAADDLRRAILMAIADLPDVTGVDVQPVTDPPWTPYRLSSALKAPLSLPADAPPGFGTPIPPGNDRVQRLLHRLRSRLSPS